MEGPSGYEPSLYQVQQQQQPAGGSSTAGVAQLFARLSQEIEEHKPKNCIHFVVDFLCKHYPEHLHGFASIWQMDPDLEGERHEVVNFFKAHKISTAVAAHFANAGYDTLDTLTTLSPDGLVDIEAFNNVKWLPGHKVRLQQIFGEISARVRAFREQQGSRRGMTPGGIPQQHTAAAYHRSSLSHSPNFPAPMQSPSYSAAAQSPSYSAAAQYPSYQPARNAYEAAMPALPAPLGVGGASLPPFPGMSAPTGLHPYLTS